MYPFCIEASPLLFNLLHSAHTGPQNLEPKTVWQPWKQVYSSSMAVNTFNNLFIEHCAMLHIKPLFASYSGQKLILNLYVMRMCKTI